MFQNSCKVIKFRRRIINCFKARPINQGLHRKSAHGDQVPPLHRSVAGAQALLAAAAAAAAPAQAPQAPGGHGGLTSAPPLSPAVPQAQHTCDPRPSLTVAARGAGEGRGRSRGAGGVCGRQWSTRARHPGSTRACTHAHTQTHSHTHTRSLTRTHQPPPPSPARWIARRARRRRRRPREKRGRAPGRELRCFPRDAAVAARGRACQSRRPNRTSFFLQGGGR